VKRPYGRSMLLNEYVGRIEEACGEGRDFIVILKYAKREEAIKRVLEKCEIERIFSGVMTQGKYKDKGISIFVSGKLIIKGLKGKEEAEEILEELLA
jgi:ribonuclease HIII